MTTRILAPALALALALALAACGGSGGQPSAPVQHEPTPADLRNEACANSPYLECMNHFAFGWNNELAYFGPTTSIGSDDVEWSQPPERSAGYSGKVLGWEGSVSEWDDLLDARDGGFSTPEQRAASLPEGYIERLNRINGTVNMEYRAIAEELDIKFEFPTAEQYNQTFRDVRYDESDCWACFYLGYYDADISQEIYAQVEGAFYGPEAQEFGGSFWRYNDVRTRTRVLISAFGATRQ